MSTPAQEERHSRPEEAGTDSQVVGEPIGARLRRWRPFLIVTAALAVVALATSLMQPTTSKIPYAIDNPKGNGTQALAQLLRDEGLRVRSADSASEAAAAGPGTTVAVVNIGLLTDDQRAALARALVNRPRLLLLDEPFGKLDALTRLTLQDEIRRLWLSQGFTAVLVTHDVDEALRLSGRVVVLSERPARVVEDIAVPDGVGADEAGEDFQALRRRILGLLGR
mgnify:CR=1 FL=1